MPRLAPAGIFINGLMHWKLLFLSNRFSVQEQTLDIALTQWFRLESEKRKVLELSTKPLTQLLNRTYCRMGLLNTPPCLTAGARSKC